MKGKRASTFVMIAIVAVLMVAAVLLINHTTIFQEGNPLPVAAGIWQLAVEGKPFAQIKDEPPTWITKTADNRALFAGIEQEYSVKYTTEQEAGYLFEGGETKLVLGMRQYSRYYQIWEVKRSNRD